MLRAFQIRAAVPVLRGLGQASLAALLGALSSCGGRQTDAVLDGASSGDLAQAEGDSPADALSLSSAQIAAASIGDGERASGADPTGGAWRVIEVPALSNEPRVVRSPLGWLALSNRAIGDSRAPSGYESVLYRSTDGVHWSVLPLGHEAENARVWGLAYGSGRYVLVGQHSPGSAVFWSSSDARAWTETPDPAARLSIGGLAYAQGRFLSVGLSQLTASEDGRDWRLIPITLVQEGGAAYGNGVYVLSGSGPMQTSSDGWAWQEHPFECLLPRACITDPSGRVLQGYHPSLLFAEGRFYTDELSSEDGALWQAEPGRTPLAYADGRFFGALSLSDGLATWTQGHEPQALRVVRPARAAVTAGGRADTSIGILDRDSPVPETVNVEFADGLTCADAACLLIGNRLLLIPPAGTPPLVEQVPRSADGAPLLSKECPVSSQLWCDDYEARSGCVCHPEAPYGPQSCQDVSQYRCAGRFSPRPEEWQLDELAQAGCSCDALDPNQPASFGRACEADASACTAPLTCLSVDPLPSGGPPSSRSICTSACRVDADCPSWQATGFCAGAVSLRCSRGSCQPRSCN